MTKQEKQARKIERQKWFEANKAEYIKAARNGDTLAIAILAKHGINVIN